MATTFDVIPYKRVNITFKELLLPSEENLNRHLTDIGYKGAVKLHAYVFDKDKRRNALPNESFILPESSYAWFVIDGVPGGTDVRSYPINNFYGNFSNDSWNLLTELISLPNYQPAFDIIIEQARFHNHLWSFRRSAGQYPIINLAYGIIAATLADITGGLIYSGDNAWDYKKFPTTGPAFMSEYFRPDANVDEEHTEWGKSNIKAIIEDNMY